MPPIPAAETPSCSRSTNRRPTKPPARGRARSGPGAKAAGRGGRCCWPTATGWPTGPSTRSAGPRAGGEALVVLAMLARIGAATRPAPA